MATISQISTKSTMSKGAADRGTILVVEDSRDQATLLQRILEPEGYTVDVVHDGKKAVERVRGGGYDLVLMDIIMPGLSGLEACRILKEDPATRATPIMLVTQLDSPADMLGGLQAGAESYVTKPYERSQILHRIASVLASPPSGRGQDTEEAMEIAFQGKNFEISAGRQHIVNYLVATVEDVLRSQELLRKMMLEGRRTETILRSTADGIITMDRSGIVQTCNRAAEKIFGYAAEEVVGNSVTLLMPSSYRAEHDDGVGWADILGREHEVEGRGKDGTTFPVALRVEELEQVGHIATLRDLTEGKMAADALRRSAAEYQGLVERAVYGIFRSSPEGRFLMANPAMVRILGYDSEEELLALDSVEMVYADPSGTAEGIGSFIDSGHMDHSPVEWRRKDGDVVSLLFSGHPVLDNSGAVAYFEVMAEDVTEQRILEKQLRQSQRLEALGQLAGGVAHDFNNLLSVIIVQAQLGLRALGEDHPVRERLGEIKAAGDRAAALTGQLLAFSRKQLVEPIVLSLNGMVSDLEKMLTRLIAEDIHFTTTLGEEPANILADRGQLEQVLTNLVVNASDAMPKGGQLAIRTSTTTPDTTFLRTHPGMTSRPYTVLEVRDTGSGISDDVKARMFDPFFTTKEQGKGTGLGLATVYGIVQTMDGSIEVESELDVGTTIRVYLPVVDEAATEVSSTEESPLPQGTETVLVVEDDVRVRKVTVQLLEVHGYTVMSAENGPQALQQLGAYEGEVHLLLTDIVMPSMGGREVAARVTQMRPKTKVLYMSGYTDDKILQQELVTREISFLPKPFTAESFTVAVRRVLDQVPQA